LQLLWISLGARDAQGFWKAESKDILAGI